MSIYRSIYNNINYCFIPTIKIIDSVFQIILHIMVVFNIVSAKYEFIKAFSKPRLGIINLCAPIYKHYNVPMYTYNAFDTSSAVQKYV